MSRFSVLISSAESAAGTLSASIQQIGTKCVALAVTSHALADTLVARKPPAKVGPFAEVTKTHITRAIPRGRTLAELLLTTEKLQSEGPSILTRTEHTNNPQPAPVRSLHARCPDARDHFNRPGS